MGGRVEREWRWGCIAGRKREREEREIDGSLFGGKRSIKAPAGGVII